MSSSPVMTHPHTGETVFNSSANKSHAYTPSQMEILGDDALSEAESTISAWPGYAPTPMVDLADEAKSAGVASVSCKDESTRFGLGSFKALGGAYAVAQLLRLKIAETKSIPLPDMSEILEGKHGDVVSNITVCCATDGNHGRSVAWGAQTFGCNCTIFIHATVSEGRRDAIAAFGANVVRTKGNYDDSVRTAQAEAEANGWYVVSDTSYPGYTEIPRFVMQGYELMAKEADTMLDEPPTHIFIQTGVGGLAAAIAAYFKRQYGDNRPYVILADPEKSACWVESFRAGEPTAIGGALDTLMAGLACGEVSLLAWEILKDHCDAAIAVDDEGAVEAMRDLAALQPPVIAGESGVAGLVALRIIAADKELRAKLDIDEKSRVLLFGTEGDTDPELYSQLVGKNSGEIRKGSQA